MDNKQVIEELNKLRFPSEETFKSIKVLQSKMDKAFKSAMDSTCLKKKVGSALISADYPFTIWSFGYGGVKISGDNPKGCEQCVRKIYEFQQDGCWSMHSELRALFSYFDLQGFTYDLSNRIMMVTHGPCDACIKYCNFFNIPAIIYATAYHNDYSKWSDKIKIYRLETTRLELEN